MTALKTIGLILMLAMTMPGWAHEAPADGFVATHQYRDENNGLEVCLKNKLFDCLEWGPAQNYLDKIKGKNRVELIRWDISGNTSRLNLYYRARPR